jgi:hypothetical protein
MSQNATERTCQHLLIALKLTHRCFSGGGGPHFFPLSSAPVIFPSTS